MRGTPSGEPEGAPGVPSPAHQRSRGWRAPSVRRHNGPARRVRRSSLRLKRGTVSSPCRSRPASHPDRLVPRRRTAHSDLAPADHGFIMSLRMPAGRLTIEKIVCPDRDARI